MTPGRQRDTIPASLAAVLALTLIILVAIAVATAKGSIRERKAQVVHALTQHWPARYRREALHVIACETGHTYDPHAVGAGGLYYGLFQQGRWQRQTYGFGWTIRAQVRSGWRAFRANGFCWTCWDQWPTCGRGLD